MSRKEFIAKMQALVLVQDIKAICAARNTCTDCPFFKCEDGICIVGFNRFNADEVLRTVEKYRKRKKPCAEVIDRALDVYTIEVEVERSKRRCEYKSASEYATTMASEFYKVYEYDDPTISILSAKRFVLESHREVEK